MDSILSMIPNTAAHRRARRQLQALRQEMDDDAVQSEMKRVANIQQLMDDGCHEEALRQLLNDTESDLQYFHRLRRRLLLEQEQMQQRKQQQNQEEEGRDGNGVYDNEDEKEKEATSMNTSTSPSSPAKRKCQWLGIDPITGHKYHCTNSCVLHPWKIYRSVHGDEEPLQMDVCPYHVRYCLDPNRRHVPKNGGTGTEDLVEVQCPNKYGLCNGCYVQYHRRLPPMLGSIRIPGRRRLVKGEPSEEENPTKAIQTSEKKTHCISKKAIQTSEKKTHCISWRDIDLASEEEASAAKRVPGAPRASTIFVSKTIGATQNKLRRTFAGGANATKIQRAWRRRKAARQRFDEKVAKNRISAATRIQSFARTALRKQRLFGSLHRISWAALCLCRVSRGFNARHVVNKMRATLRIQQAWRQYQKKVKSLHRLQCQELVADASRSGAATAIQRWAHQRMMKHRWKEYIRRTDEAIEQRSTYSHVANGSVGCFGSIEGGEEIDENDRRNADVDGDGNHDSSSEASLATTSSSDLSGVTCNEEDSVGKTERCASVTEDILQYGEDFDTIGRSGVSCDSPHEAQESTLPISQHLPANRLNLDENIFSRYETGNKGSISKHKFKRVLMEIWESNDSILLQPEFEAIVDLFDRYRTGSVDYQSFLRFARLQTIPCQVHSRLVCAQCVIYGGSLDNNGSGRNEKMCSVFESSPKSASICQCGRYKEAHEVLPKPPTGKPLALGTAKVMVTDGEMSRIFALKRQPDLALPFGVTSTATLSTGRLPLRGETNHNLPEERSRKLRTPVTGSHEKKPETSAAKKLLVSSGNMKVSAKLNVKRTSVQGSLRVIDNPGPIPDRNAVPVLPNKPIALAQAWSDTDTTLAPSWPREVRNMVQQMHIPRRSSSSSSSSSSSRYKTCPFPNCKRAVLDVQKHLISHHTDLEMQYLVAHVEKIEEGRVPPIQHIGKRILVPPFEPPIEIPVCMNHVPPCPRCPACLSSIKQNWPLTPIRYFDEMRLDLGGDEKMWLNVDKREDCITFFHEATNRNCIAQIAGLCQDGIGRYFVACHLFYTQTEILGMDIDEEDRRAPRHDKELFMSDRISFVEMQFITGACDVLNCDACAFDGRRRVRPLQIGNNAYFCTTSFDIEERRFRTRE